MSGGSFDYAYSRMAQFADELTNKLDEQGSDHRGWPLPTWPPEVAAKLREIAGVALLCSKLAKEAEWLYSGDTSEETFMARVAAIEDGK